MAYGHKNMKYTYIDTTRQSYRYIASSYNDWEAFLNKSENLCGCGFSKVSSCTCAVGHSRTSKSKIWFQKKIRPGITPLETGKLSQWPLEGDHLRRAVSGPLDYLTPDHLLPRTVYSVTGQHDPPPTLDRQLPIVTPLST